MYWLPLVLTAVIAPLPAHGAQYFVDQANLRLICTDTASDQAVASGICLGYIIGSVDQVIAQQTRRGMRSSICIPSGLSAVEVETPVLRYITSHPAAPGPVSGSIYRALRAAFPCRNGLSQ